MLRISILIILISSGTVLISFSQEVPTPVKAKLLSDAAVVQPGGTFNLGVLFEIDPGWHIYWKHPGETGLPTEVTFNVPTDFKVGELMWPTHLAIEKPDGGHDYGYENSVLLWSKIEVPLDIKKNTDFEIQTQVSWLSCKEICIPGRAVFDFDAMVGDKPESINENIFTVWQEKLPQTISNN